MAAELASLVSRLEAVTTRLESVALSSGGSGGGGSVEPTEAVAPFVLAFDDILNGPLKNFFDLSDSIGGDVKTQGAILKEAFGAQRGLLVVASTSKQPPQDVLVKLLEPISKKMQEIEEFVSKNRRSDHFNHLSGIGSSVPALGWVTVSPAPGPFVKDMSDSGQFYLNRVLKDFRDKDKTHVDWTRAWTTTLTELQAYIKQHHTTGLTWNPKGKDATAATASPTPTGPRVPPPPSAGGPPPPPPPPSVDSLFETEPKTIAAAEEKSKLFAEINQGTDVTKGLRKVSDDMKTHKNPNLRLTAQPYKPKTSPKPSLNPFGAKKIESVKPPKCALEGKKWVVEYQSSNKALVLSDTNAKQTVYIYKCDNSTIQIKNKVNSIVVDSCKKTAVVFEGVISSIDFINSHSIQAQVSGKVQTVNIDKTDGCQVYLSKESINAEIISAKSSEMNILVPDDSGEFSEHPLPEQYKSVWDGKKFVTLPSDIV